VKGQYENNYLDQPKEEEGYWDIMPKYSEYGHPASPTEGLLPETPELSQPITGTAGRHLNYSKPINYCLIKFIVCFARSLSDLGNGNEHGERLFLNPTGF
jgi:hypothetical protein